MKIAEQSRNSMLASQLPLIVAHRGSSAIAPENTLAAFRRAISDGAEGIEFDVRLSKDNQPVVFHDLDLKRICGMEEKVSDLNASSLRNLDAGSWFNRINKSAKEDFSVEGIPTLAETLDLLSGFRGAIYVELKADDSDAASISTAVAEVIESSGLISQVIVKSFDLEFIQHFRNRLPLVKTASLFTPKVKTVLNKEKRLIRVSSELGVDRISLHFSLATKRLMRKAYENGLPVTIWTVDSPRWIKRAIELGIDHIITNEPAQLLARRTDFLSRQNQLA